MRYTILTALTCVGLAGIIRAADIPVGLNVKTWHIYKNDPACRIEPISADIDQEEGPALKISFTSSGEKHTLEARHSFTPRLKLDEYTHLRFQVKVEPTSTGRFGHLVLRGGDKNRFLSFAGMCDLGRVPANLWLPITLKLPADLIKSGITQLAIGYAPKEFPDIQAVSFTVADMKFTKKPLKKKVLGNPALTALWNEYIKNYKPDYSDGSYLMRPPHRERLPVPLPIAVKGVAAAEIVLDSTKTICLPTAASELKLWIKKISGAELPILTEPSNANNTKLWLGRKWAGRFEDDIKYLEGTDGYAIRSRGNNVYLFGAIPKGALNAVYRLLEANSDIIWSRPDPKLGAVFSKAPDFKLVWAATLSKPASRLRGWGTNWGFNRYDEIWNYRNLCNAPAGGGGFDPSFTPFRRKWGHQCINYGGGHNLFQFLPGKKYFKDHPEYYAMLNGKRQYPKAMENQPCFTNKEGAEAFTTNALAILGKAPKGTNTIPIMIEDNWGCCECPNCLKPIKLSDGTQIDVTDPAFRSTQFQIFLNNIARIYQREAPNVTITSYAYFFTAVPPKIKPLPNIRFSFCPYVRNNDKFPLFTPVNSKWWKRITLWSEMSKRVFSREYYGVGTAFPRPLSEVVAWDLRELVNLGVKEFTSEIAPDKLKHRSKVIRASYNWDASMMDYWVITRLFWNPYVNVEELRRYFVYRTFREAALPMLRYYGTLREAWYADPLPSTCGDTPVNCTKHYIIDKGLEKKLLGYLTEAETLALNPVSRKLIQLHRARLDSWLAKAKALKTPSVSVPLLDNAAEATADFNSSLWKDATVINGFKIMRHPKQNSKHKTVVKLLHDAKKLYIFYHCADKNIADVFAVDGKNKTKETWTSGDHGEVFLTDQSDKTTYYQFAFDCLGNKCDLNNHQRMEWNGKWDCVVRKTKDGWDAILSIPLKTINLNLGKGKKIKALFYRQYDHNDRKLHENSSWGGGGVHQTAEFGEITLMR